MSRALRHGRWRLLVTAGAFAVLAVVVAWFVRTGPEVVDALGDFDTRLLLPIALLVLGDYTLRFWRWRWLFRRAAGRTLPLREDVNLFMAGTAMILTPGRAGELVKPLYAQRLHGIPFARTAPIPLIERMVDVGAMLFLASAGAVIFTSAWLLLLIPAALLVGLVASKQQRLFAGATGLLKQKLRLDDFIEGFRVLWRPGPLAMSFVLGLLAWGLECIAFALVLIGAGADASVALFGKACFIYPLATLAGTVSFLPGGLGITEGGIAGMTQATLAMGAGPAAVASLLIRGAIVGLPVLAGVPSFLHLGRASLRAAPVESAAADEPPGCVTAA